MNFFYNEKTKTAIIQLKVKTCAKTSSINGFVDINGSHTLKINIKSAPEGGKANIAIIKMLSEIWKLKRSQLKIIKGTTSSTKILAVENIEKADMALLL